MLWFSVILVRFLPFFTIVFIFYLLVIFPSQTRIRVNIKVVRCLEYSASLVSTQSVLRRNSDNNEEPVTVCKFALGLQTLIIIDH